MSRFKLYFFIFSLCFQFCFSLISDKRLCLDEECSQPISKAKTMLAYSAPDSYQLSFRPNEEVIIYSKSAGSNEALWGAEIRGKRGYIPKTFVRELKKLSREEPKILVDTELVKDSTPQVPPSEETVRPSKLKQNHEVIDGTTIYQQPYDQAEETSQENVKTGTVENISSENENVPKTLNEIDSKNEQKENEEEETTAESGGYLSDMLGTMLDMVNPLNIEDNDSELSTTKSKESSADSKETSNTSGELKDIFSNNTVINTSDKSDTPYEKTEEEKNSDIKTNQSDSSLETVESSTENLSNIVENSTEERSVIDSIDETQAPENLLSQRSTSSENPQVNSLTSTENPNIIENSTEETVNIDSIDENQVLKKPENLSSKTFSYSEEILIPNSPKIPDTIKKDSILEKLAKLDEKVHDTPIETKKNSTNQENIKSDSDPSDAQVPEIPPSSNTLEIKNSSGIEGVNDGSSIDGKSESLHEKIENLIHDESAISSENITESKENIIENKHNITENKSENQQKAEASNLLKETFTEKAYVPNTPEVPDEPVTGSPKIAEGSADIEAETSNSSSSQLLNDTSTDQSPTPGPNTAEITENPIEIVTKTFKEEEREENASEIVESHTNPEKIDEDIVEINENNEKSVHVEEKLVTSKINSFSETTPSYLGNVPSYTPTITEEKTEKYDQIDTSEEYYTDKENDSSINENYVNNEHISTENTFSSPPDISKNIDQDYESKTIETNEITPEETASVETEKQPEYNDESNIGLFSYLGKAAENMRNERKEAQSSEKIDNAFVADQQDCIRNDGQNGYSIPMDLNLSSDFFLYLATTAISVITFLLGYLALDKSRREGPLVAKINKLEKEYLIILKEKEILTEQIDNGIQNNDEVQMEDFLNLQKEYDVVTNQKQALEEQIQTLEKELENSTEVGLELNRMLSDLLSSENAGETLMSNIEQLQAQLAEQQEIVSSMKETLSLKETENHELNLELDIANKKVVELQSELDKLLLNIMKVEEEKETQEKNSESEIIKLKEKLNTLSESLGKHQAENLKIVDELKSQLSTSERSLQLKIKEYDGLKTSMQKIKTVKNANTLESLLEVNSIKAELEQLKTECEFHCNSLKKEKENNSMLEKKAKSCENEIDIMSKKFDETDRARLELETKLQVLTTYFKDRETQLQKDLSKYESMWSAKQGEATSTSERIKYLQSEVQNYKTQNESLKEEIVSQEVELKSQISVLEKKVHENWVSARQAERRLEDLKQEAAQLRNRLTLRERALQEDKSHNRMQSPLEPNGDVPMPPLHLESPSSPPLLYNSRDHITKSPAMMGMPPPFLPPPPGAPFLPPPHMPFMPPPPPDMFPGDHRPPPLGRMSSPPLNSRYSPDRRPYSPYDRSPSPSYDESDYVTSPVHHRRYSPFSGMDHRRMPPPLGKVNGRSGALSSGSGNSNESLDEINRPNSKV